MNGWIIAFAILELVGLAAIIHLWLRRRMRRFIKCFWTIFLLIPFFGPLFYEFLTNNPDPHGEDPIGGQYPG
jgi:energy-coupling factor transporter transmembrane protein EcfT